MPVLDPPPPRGQYAQLRARTRERRIAERLARTPTTRHAARGAALGFGLVLLEALVAQWWQAEGLARGEWSARRVVLATLVVGVAASVWAAGAALGTAVLRGLRRRGWPV